MLSLAWLPIATVAASFTRLGVFIVDSRSFFVAKGLIDLTVNKFVSVVTAVATHQGVE